MANKNYSILNLPHRAEVVDLNPALAFLCGLQVLPVSTWVSSGIPKTFMMQRSVAPRGFGKHCGTLKRRRWGGLRRQWELLGLFEIDQHHEFYSLTCMMKEGLFSSILTTIDHPSTNQLLEDDFRAEDTQIHKGFKLETFAGPVFANLRRSLGVTEQEYQQSLCSDKCYLQFISNSKSKADFFLTNDKRFFLKTQNEREIRFLLDNLKNYMAHLQKYPHSLLVKLLEVLHRYAQCVLSR